MTQSSAQQWADWTARLLAGKDLEGELIKSGILPGPDSPPPKTNATLHILAREDGYGTRERRFTTLCGVSWLAVESTGENRYFHQSETCWHKHVNCERCLEILRAGE